MNKYFDKNTDKEARVFFVDAEKAFDNLNWTFLFELLDELKTGDKFGMAIKGIYNSQKTRLIINNELSEWIQVNKGTRQGCPLSPLLFILVLETLLIC